MSSSITDTTKRASATDEQLVAMIAEVTKCLSRAQDGIAEAAAEAAENGFDDYTDADLRFASTRIDAATILLGIMRNTLGDH